MMKKFLSSLLALTMILSLVIVPANAADQALADGYTLNGSFSVTADKESVASGETVNLTAANITATKTSAESQPTFTYTYTWGSGATPTTSGAKTATATPTTSNTAGDSKTYSCTLVIMDTTNNTKVLEKTESVRVGVTNAQAAFEATVTKVTLAGRSYDISKSNDGTWSATVYYFGNDEPTEGIEANAGYSTYDSTNKKLTVKKTNSSDETIKHDVSITLKKANPSVEVVLDGDSDSGISLFSGFTYTFKATYENKDNSSNVIAGTVKYNWTVADSNGSKIYSKDNSTNTFKWTAGSKGSYTLTCSVDEGNSKDVTRANKTLTVEDNPYSPDRSGESSSKTIATNNSATCEIKAPVLKSSNDIIPYRSNNTDNFDIAWVVTRGSSLVSVVKRSADGYGIVTAKSGAKSGTATVTATITYMGKEYPALEYTIDISALDAELSAITNGDNDSYRQSTLEEKLATAINKVTKTAFTSNDINKVQVATVPSHATLKYNSSKLTAGDEVSKGLDIYADNGYIGDDSFQLKVNGTYIVTLYFKIEGDKDIKDTVTGSASGKDVTFTNSDYDYLFVYKGSASFKSSMYDGDWSKTSGHSSDWTPVKKNSDYTVKSSAFDKNGKATLYVVVVDDDIASTGTITVSQKSYDIKYSVVAGESVTFSQKDFESFLEDIADDAGNYNSRKDTLELSYVKFSLPNSTREGVLYDGKSKIDRNDKVEDLDKVTFESVAKAKDTITISFTAYGKLYKDGASKGKDVEYSGNVVISVVKEDIVFEVGVNSAVKLGSDKFIDFLRDSDKSYKKADLDYVTFDVGKNSAITSYFNGTGALYRYYNGSTGINSTVSAKDEFYYNPKTSSKHYDLDDVTYVTSKFAKVGDIVYIPFTAYGTKSGQKAEGTLAIKVKQTMNFVDVRPGDYFYDSVQWAVNLDITKGTSATTFSPKQGCTRAQIVTFLWRAANSPAPRSSTNKFTDVYATTHADYMKAIIWATEQGITTGTGNGKFSPDATCTRAQIVTFLYRFKSNPAVYGSLNFSDVNKTEHAAFYNAILWAVNNKITTGYGNGIFDPNGTCNRGDAVTFLYRALA